MEEGDLLVINLKELRTRHLILRGELRIQIDWGKRNELAL